MSKKTVLVITDGIGYSPKGTEWVYQMAAEVAGGLDKLQERLRDINALIYEGYTRQAETE